MRTRRPLAAFEIAIDRVCGFARRDAPIMVKLRCVGPCGNVTELPAVEDWPDGTVEITVTCADCGASGEEIG